MSSAKPTDLWSKMSSSTWQRCRAAVLISLCSWNYPIITNASGLSSNRRTTMSWRTRHGIFHTYRQNIWFSELGVVFGRFGCVGMPFPLNQSAFGYFLAFETQSDKIVFMVRCFSGIRKPVVYPIEMTRNWTGDQVIANFGKLQELALGHENIVTCGMICILILGTCCVYLGYGWFFTGRVYPLSLLIHLI